MNAKINDGGPAFPVPDVIDHDRNYYQYGGQGMTLRDYFAAKAMAAYLAHLSSLDCTVSKHYPEIANEAYEIADAMLKAREVQP